MHPRSLSYLPQFYSNTSFAIRTHSLSQPSFQLPHLALLLPPIPLISSPRYTCFHCWTINVSFRQKCMSRSAEFIFGQFKVFMIYAHILQASISKFNVSWFFSLSVIVPMMNVGSEIAFFGVFYQNSSLWLAKDHFLNHCSAVVYFLLSPNISIPNVGIFCLYVCVWCFVSPFKCSFLSN